MARLGGRGGAGTAGVGVIPHVKHSITCDDETAVLACLRSGALTQGEAVPAFEQELANISGAKHCVCVNSGTAALTLALRGVGVKVGTWVWTSPISFMATANAVLLAGANVGFTDVDVRGLVTGWAPSEVFLPVTLGGNPYDLSLRQRQKTVIVDACHGPLTLPDGATAACFSFHPAKHIACGEGGAVVTNDEALAARVRLLRDHGRDPIPRRMVRLSGNHRMPDLNAALGLSQLARYEDGVRERRRLAALYDAAFAGKVETVPHHPDSARHLYQVLVEDRDALRDRLLEQGIGTQVHYPPIPAEPFYQGMYPGWARELANTVRFAAHVLSLPLYPGLTDAEQEKVINAILD